MSEYIYITTLESADKYLRLYENAKVVGVDTETTGLDPHTNKIRLIQLAAERNPTLVIDAFKVDIHNTYLPKLLSTPEIIKVAHNWVFDYKMFKSEGILVVPKLFDSQVAEQLILSGHISKRAATLRSVCNKYLGLSLDKEERLSDWSAEELTPEQIGYAAKDAEVLLPLRLKLIEEIDRLKLRTVAKIEFDAIPAIAEMEYHGMKIDLDLWGSWTAQLLESKTKVDTEIHEELKPPEKQQLSLFSLGGSEFKNFIKTEKVNIDSTKELLGALKRNGINIKSTGNPVIAPLQEKYPILGKIIEYRKYSTALKSFALPIPEYINKTTGRVHPHYWQLGAGTGRFSCSNPNMQNIPRGAEVRKMFVPEKGYKLVIADYSQIELRILGVLSNDPVILEAYSSGRKADLHKTTAANLTGKKEEEVTKEDRSGAKASNFGLAYGQGLDGFIAYSRLTFNLILSRDQGNKLRDGWFSVYKGVKQWHNNIYRKCDQDKKNNRLIETRTLTGRRRTFTHEKAYLNPLANTPTQGTGADIVKNALGKLWYEFFINRPYLDIKFIACVHDEIVLEVLDVHAEEAALILSEVMEAAGSEILKQVPCIAEASIGDSWADKK